MTKPIRFSLLIALLFLNCEAFAAFTPLSVNLVPPVQFPPSDYNITGLRTSLLFGRQRDMYGIDLGVLGNITDQNFVGLAVSGLFNITHGQTTALGAQLAGGANYNSQKTDVYGLQLALGANINKAASSVTGLQFALVNLADHTNVYGVQAGLYNRALAVYGFQIGLINVCDNLHGLQIGLLNFHSKGLFNVSPILNIGF